MNYTADVSSAVIFVSELERSVRFYSELFGCEPSLDADGAALLLTPGGFRLYLIASGSAEMYSTGGIGGRHLLWATDSPEGLAYASRGR